MHQFKSNVDGVLKSHLQTTITSRIIIVFVCAHRRRGKDVPRQAHPYEAYVPLSGEFVGLHYVILLSLWEQITAHNKPFASRADVHISALATDA